MRIKSAIIVSTLAACLVVCSDVASADPPSLTEESESTEVEPADLRAPHISSVSYDRPESFELFKKLHRPSFGFIESSGAYDPSIHFTARAILNRADQLTLYSIDPAQELKPTAAMELFHGYRVLGKTTIGKAQDRKKLLKALLNGIDEARGTAHFLCFEPRHGLRAQYGHESVDLVICFTCSEVLSYGTVNHSFKITRSPSEALNRVLKAKQIAIAK